MIITDDMLKAWPIEVLERSLVAAYISKKQYSILPESLRTVVEGAEARLVSQILNHEPFDLESLVLQFEQLLPSEKRKKDGIVFTPGYIANYISHEAISNAGTHRGILRVIDPSCGSAAFLLAAAKVFKSLESTRSISQIIKESIYGIDLYAENVRRSIMVLQLLALSEGSLLEANEINVKVADSLKENWTEMFGVRGFDCVIGNPPYVNTHDMQKDTISYLKKNFETTTKGTFNIFYAFIEHGLKYLARGGCLGFIIPNNYLTITAAEGLRRLLTAKPLISKIIDFDENMIFAPVRTYNSLLFLSLDREGWEFEYARIEKTDDIAAKLHSAQFISVNGSELDPASWHLLNANEKEFVNRVESAGHPLKPMIRVGIATLKDDAYIVDGFDAERNMFIKNVGNESFYIESEAVKGLYKIPDLKQGTSLESVKRHIIFPYELVEKQDAEGNRKMACRALEEHAFEAMYPECYRYMLRQKEYLATRGKGKPVKPYWYSYGRSQGLTIQARKLLFPTFSLNPRFELEPSIDTLFCNGYAILESDVIELEILQKVLNSEIMKQYMILTSYAIEGNYRCYQKKYLQNFSIPDFTGTEKEFLLRCTDPGTINSFLETKYGVDLASVR